MRFINRTVAIIRPKEPFVAWANQLRDATYEVMLEDLREDCLAVLIPEYGKACTICYKIVNVLDEENILVVCWSARRQFQRAAHEVQSQGVRIAYGLDPVNIHDGLFRIFHARRSKDGQLKTLWRHNTVEQFTVKTTALHVVRAMRWPG